MADSIPVLTFHAIDAQPSLISFRPRLFQRGMARLYDSGYRTLSLLEVADCLRRGLLFPDRSFAITFDDGYQSVYAQAFPILQRYGFSATVFLTVGEQGKRTLLERLPSMEGRRMLSWREINDMHQAGITFGAHTLTHPDLTRLPLERVTAEICNSKDVIEDILGTDVACFAYPYGRYDDARRTLVSRHFTCAFSDRLGLIEAGSDLYALERVDAYYLNSEKLFDVMLSSLFPWYIRARSVPRQIRRAVIPRFGRV
jgi:peptidoglycan/xylan/chitin deacetylase (PgdA/CDA1 family)